MQKTILLLIAILGTLLVFLYREKAKPTETLNNQNVSVLVEKWGREIDEKGPEAAYLDLKYSFEKNGLTRDSFLPHISAHVFGRLLYEKWGLTALKYCDQAFSFGCYHGVFDSFISEKGMASIPTLFEKCEDLFRENNSWGCKHGIGHGIAEINGPEKLLASLDACREDNPKITPFGCIGGVLMEYNFPAFSKETISSVPIRDFEAERPYFPCENLPEIYKEACYVRLTEWWEVSFSKDYKAMGKLCEGVGDAKIRLKCFMGIGATASVSHDFIIRETLASCDLVSTKTYLPYCRAGARWMFESVGNFESINICANLGVKEKNICETKNLTEEKIILY